MNDFLKQHLRGDRAIWAVYIVLVCVSLVEGYSSQSFFVSRASSTTAPLLSHAAHLLLGFVAILFLMTRNYRSLRMLAWIVWTLSLGLLVYTFFRGGNVNGASRWAFGIQPSEFAKFGLITVTADWILRAKHPTTGAEFEEKWFVWFAVLIAVTIGLILPGNLSTAILLYVVVAAMLWVGGINWKRILKMTAIFGGGAALIIALAFVIPQEHFVDEETHRPRADLNVIEATYYKVLGRSYTWASRISRFTEHTETEELAVDDNNRQQLYGKVAIARGGLFPSMPGSSKMRNKLPQAYSDYVYSIIIEELGSLFGGLGMMFLYLFVLFRAGRVVRKSTNVYPAMLAMGAALMLVLQALTHMAVCAGAIPVTGQPLPLVTRGGSSILLSSMYFGVLLNVTCYAYENKEASEELAPVVEAETEPEAANEEKQ